MRALVAGATGYVGRELVRLLYRHPQVEVVSLVAHSEAGTPTDRLFPAPGLPSRFEAPEAVAARPCDVAFLALPAAEAAAMAERLVDRGARVIDLGAAFRFARADVYEKWYGPHPAPHLLEVAQSGYADDPAFTVRPETRILGNPGCYPTAVYAAVGPLTAAGLIPASLIVNGCSGVSGAGRTARPDLMLAEMAENLVPYSRPGGHRHTAEMEAVAQAPVLFQPHLAPMDRGILVTVYWPGLALPAPAVHQRWREFYAGNPFVTVLDDAYPAPRQVRGSNRVAIHAEHDPARGVGVLYAALDNLVKGAAGQAVQHLNRWMGWPADSGLEVL